MKTVLETKVETTISNQKYVSDIVLDVLEAEGFKALVAGGAPRDWYFNRPAKDIDVFVESPTTGHLLTVLFDMFGTLKKVSGQYLNETVSVHAEGIDAESDTGYITINEYDLQLNGDDYRSNHIFAVYEGNYKGQIVQFILVDKPITAVVAEDFNASIQKATYDGNACFYHEDFIRSVRTKTITHSSKNNASKFSFKKIRLDHLEEYQDLIADPDFG